MPELPDVTIYVDALNRLIVGRRLIQVDLRSPFDLRTIEPELSRAEGQEITAVHRMGKKIILEMPSAFFLVFHLMIAGRFHWRKPDTKPRAKTDLAAFHFEHGVLMLTEASAKKRAALYVIEGRANLEKMNPQGLEVLECDEISFRDRLRSENHTLKRALTDPRLFSGIGNAYSDEILNAAQLSPLKWTSRLTDVEVTRLFHATQSTLTRWIEQLQDEMGEGFPEKVTAFRQGMAVHGKFGFPCPQCGTPVQRIVFSENETNYCPTCQTEGKLLADRSLSRLLKDDWPRSLDEL